MTQIDDKALEAAVLAHDKEEAAMRGEPDPWVDERPDGEFSDRKAAMAEAIRAYLSAASSDVSGLVDQLGHVALVLESRNLPGAVPVCAEAATALTALAAKVAKMEAENARLRAELDEATVYARNLLTAFVGEHFPDNDRWKPLGDLAGMLTQIDNASTIAREYKARLAEALQALEPFAEQADNPQWWNDSSIRREHFRAARRALAGGE